MRSTPQRTHDYEERVRISYYNALGYKHMVTYTRQSENGSSLRAAGWKYDGKAGGTHWTGQRYEQTEMVLDEMKVRWRKDA